MKSFKYARVTHPGYSDPKVFCTDANTCEYILRELVKDYNRNPPSIRKDKYGNLLEFELDCGKEWFEASTWVLQYLLDQGWEPFGVTSTDNGNSSFLHLRLYTGSNGEK